MQNDTPSAPTSRKMKWTGYIMSALPVLALVLSGVMKLMRPVDVIKGFAHFGYVESSIIPLGIVELACTALYVIPATSVLGAILMTGYLGGALATTYRIGEGWITPAILGVLVWGGLFLRDARIRALIPLRRC